MIRKCGSAPSAARGAPSTPATSSAPSRRPSFETSSAKAATAPRSSRAQPALCGVQRAAPGSLAAVAAALSTVRHEGDAVAAARQLARRGEADARRRARDEVGLLFRGGGGAALEGRGRGEAGEDLAPRCDRRGRRRDPDACHSCTNEQYAPQCSHLVPACHDVLTRSLAMREAVLPLRQRFLQRTTPIATRKRERGEGFDL